MSYNGTGALGRSLGYDSWAAFATDERTPTASGAVEMLEEANFVVNFAYHNSPSNASNANHTGLLSVYEKKVFKRILHNNWNTEKEKKSDYDEYLLPAERDILGTLGGAKSIMTKFNRSIPD